MRGFGDLEAAIMDRLWSSAAPMTVRQMRDSLATDRESAYTTVMTVMDNLHTKGWLRRDLKGRAYVYQTVASREAHSANVMREALDGSGDRNVAFMHFVEGIEDEDTQTLRAVLRRLSRRRQRGD